MSFVPLALTDDDRATHLKIVESDAHGAAGSLIGIVSLSLSYPASTAKGGGFGDAKEVEILIT